MKKFILKLITYAICTILLIYSIQMALSFKIKNKSTNGLDNLVTTSNINAELLLMGSSRCWAHFDPHFFESAFNIKKAVNIGVDGHSELSMTYVRLLDYLSYNKPPKFIIINVDPFISANSIDQYSRMVNKNKYARYAFYINNRQWKTVDYFKFNFYEKYIPLYSIFKYQIFSDCLFGNNSSPYFQYGYEKHDNKWDTIQNPTSNTTAKKYFLKPKNIPEIKTSLQKIQTLCITHGVKLICIQTPVYKSIYNEYEFNLTKEICKDLNLDFFDLNVPYIRNDISNFYNSNHMNINGILKMNAIMLKNDTLKNILSPIKNGLNPL
jgi:hypothetical protein